MRWSPLTAVSALVGLLGLAACDKGDETKANELEAAAAAALGIVEEDEEAKAKAKAIDERVAQQRREQREAELAEQAEQDAKLAAIAAAVVRAPAKPSSKLEPACDALVVVYAGWVKAVYFDDDRYQLEFFDSKRKNLGAVKGRCAKLASIEATDCMVEVIKAVSAGDMSEADRKLIQGRPDFLFDKCIEAFAPDKR